MSATRVVLCRHGETDPSALGRFCGELDAGLSPRGAAEADALAAALVGELPVALFTSPARRARETAERIGSRLGLEPIVEPRLREIDFGELDGLPFEEVEARWPELYGEWLRAPTRVQFPGGECYRDLRRRAVDALADVTALHPGRTAVIVTHAGVIRALIATWLSLPDEAVFRIDQRYASVNVVDWPDGTPVLRLLNGPPTSLGRNA